MTSNQVSFEDYNKLIDAFRQKQLQYKTKIIELQKEKQYETNRANDFQLKFKQAMLQNGSSQDQDFVKKMYEKDNQINNLRMEIFKLKRSQGAGLIDNNESTQQIKHLISQNQQMANAIQQLKSAAISAIMSKDQEIQDLTQKIKKCSQLVILYQNSIQRQQSLQKQLQDLRIQSQKQKKQLSQKLIKERQKYLQKIQQFQNNLQQQQSSKQELIQKAMTLQDNLENKDKILEHYKNQITQYQNHFKQNQQNLSKQKQKYIIQIDILNDKNNMLEKQQKTYELMINEYKIKEKQSQIMYDRLKQQNSELNRKLSIKKRKHNPKMNSSDIYKSFQGISQKSSFYSSFYKPTQTKPTTLGQIQELDQSDIIDSFIDLDQRKDIEDIPKTMMKKKQNTDQIQIISKDKPKDKQIQQAQKKQINQTNPRQDKKFQVQANSNKQKQQSKQLQQLKMTINELMSQIKSLKSQNTNLKNTINQTYAQMQQMTKQLKIKAEQLLRQKQIISQLRSQSKKSQTEKQLIVEFENIKQHVFKLQNALLIEKLQNAEKQEFMKQKILRQKKSYQEKIAKLNEQLSPKKKKGFFGR